MLRFLTNSEMGHIATDFDSYNIFKMSKINAKYTYLKQISHTTYFYNIFELIKYKKLTKHRLEVRNMSNTVLLLIELKLFNIQNLHFPITAKILIGSKNNLYHSIALY